MSIQIHIHFYNRYRYLLYQKYYNSTNGRKLTLTEWYNQDENLLPKDDNYLFYLGSKMVDILVYAKLTVNYKR